MTESHSNQPVLIFIRGMPGSGKSYLAEELLKSFGPDHAVMLDPDAADYEAEAYKEVTEALNAEGVDPKVHPFRYLRAQAYDGIASGKLVIWNQPFTNRGMFDRLVANLQAYAADKGISAPTLVVEVSIDPTVARERVLQRRHGGGHGPSEGTLDRRISEYQSYHDGYDVVTVDGQSDVTESVSKVLQALRDLKP